MYDHLLSPITNRCYCSLLLPCARMRSKGYAFGRVRLYIHSNASYPDAGDTGTPVNQAHAGLK